MKKELLLVVVCLVIGIVSYQFKKEYLTLGDNMSDIALANIDALMNPEDTESGSNTGGGLSGDGEALSGNGESGNSSGEFTREDCLRKGGNWNMASVCVDGSVIQIQCETSGEMTVLGVILKGSFKKGDIINLAWERYSCQSSEGNCCVKQGIFVKEITK